MNPLFSLAHCRLGLPLAAWLLSSCVPYYDSYYDAYQGGYRTDAGPYEYRTYGGAPLYGVYGSPYPISYDLSRRYPSYSYGAYGSSFSRCYRCGYTPCRCGSHYRYGTSGTGYRAPCHSDHSSRSKSSQSHANLKHRPNSYQIVGGSVGPGRTQPKGYHSVDWYKKRGYNVNNLKLRNEKGDYYKGRSGGSSKKKK